MRAAGDGTPLVMASTPVMTASKAVVFHIQMAIAIATAMVMANVAWPQHTPSKRLNALSGHEPFQSGVNVAAAA